MLKMECEIYTDGIDLSELNIHRYFNMVTAEVPINGHNLDYLVNQCNNILSSKALDEICRHIRNVPYAVINVKYFQLRDNYCATSIPITIDFDAILES